MPSLSGSWRSVTAREGSVSGPIASHDVQSHNANGLVTVTFGPEYKYCKILKATSKLRLDTVLIQETHVNGLVDCK